MLPVVRRVRSAIPFGGTRCVALLEIEDAATVTILAVRHPVEEDHH